MSGGVYGGGERASGIGLPSLKRPHLQPCAPNPRDPSSGHPGACHLCARVWVLRHSYFRSSPDARSYRAQPLQNSTPHRPIPRPFPSQKREWLKQGHWKRRDSRGMTPTLRILDSRPSSHLPRRVLKVARLWLCPDLPSELYRGREFGRDPPHNPVSPHR